MIWSSGLGVSWFCIRLTCLKLLYQGFFKSIVVTYGSFSFIWYLSDPCAVKVSLLPAAHLVLHGHRPAAGRHRHPAHARPRHPRHQEAAHPDQEPGSPHLLLGSYWGRRGSRNCSHLFFRLIMDLPSASLVMKMSLISYLLSEIKHSYYIWISEKLYITIIKIKYC